jgi:2-amino-4-hydroxy-6-hydroxymethyldihydropteridine diphosphokinase
MPRAFVGLGANLGDPPRQIENALAALAEDPDIDFLARSALYRSAPLGPTAQPDFCNAACALASALAPQALLEKLLLLERGAGRERRERWGPRLLDLDLLHVEGVRLKQPGLTLPHAELAHRGFVLVPLAEIAPELVIPGVGRLADCGAPERWPDVRRWGEAR